MSQDKKFYVYVHRYASGPKHGQVFYVGKGYGGRYKRNSSRNLYWHNIVNKYGFTTEIVMRFEREACAFSMEVALIKFYGRDNLCNLSDGGEINSGWKHSDEWKASASRMRSGSKNPNYGKELSQEQKEAISKSLTGRPSPKKGIPSNVDKELQSKRIKFLHSLPDDENPYYHSQRNKSISMRKKLSKPVETHCGIKFYGMHNACTWLRDNGFKSASHGPISMCCNGKRDTAYGFKWRLSSE